MTELLRMSEVYERLTVSRDTGDRMRKRGDFPPAVRVHKGQKGLRWRREDVDAWIASKIETPKVNERAKAVAS